MENTHGTHIGQANRLPVSHSPGFVSPPEGSAFAAINPPVNPARVLETPSGSSVTIVDHSMVNASVENIKQRIEGFQRPTPHWQTLPICAVVTIANAEWRPTKPEAIPKSITQGMGMSLSAHYAMVYNQSDLARQLRRWAVVTTRGTVLILSGIPEAQRPTNPADFPPCVQAGLTYGRAESIAVESNGPRFAIAAVPREWTISLRRADCVDDMHPADGPPKTIANQMVKRFAVADLSSMRYQTDDQVEAMMFASGRAGDAVVVAILRPDEPVSETNETPKPAEGGSL